VPQLAADLISQGAKFIIANSDDMKDGIREAAAQYPDVRFLHISGDDVLTGKAPKNLGNLMGRMEYGQMMAGFAAAMTSKTGKIGYLGPLANEETRRLAVASYLGARYAWQEVLHKDLKDLKFQVTWIGFWFHIPGVTTDPTQVTQNFFNSDYDVVISGLDTTEALVVAQQKRKEGKDVHAIPYDYQGACELAPEACLGVRFYNWGPAYVQQIQAAKNGTWKPDWLWLGPDWKDINNPDTSMIGFTPGAGLKPEAKQALDRFIGDLGGEKVQLFKGPLNFQDGKPFLKEGETATDKQIWYMEQMLQGMEGSSGSKS
jgi:simple sugar transport system substrate-binding protein